MHTYKTFMMSMNEHFDGNKSQQLKQLDRKSFHVVIQRLENSFK